MIRPRLDRLVRRLERPYEVYNRIEVSRSALLHNARFFASATGQQVVPVLKGNAYGHGIEQVATALRDQPFPYVAVDGYFEALKVRACNPRQRILVMGMIKPQNIPRLRLRGLAFVVQDKATIHAFGALRRRVPVHLEINTGMNRYGIRPDELKQYLELLQLYPHLQLEGVMAHLADADGTDEQNIVAAVDHYDACVDSILAAGFAPRLFHTAQSAGSVRARSRYANALRLGIGLYGINPFPAEHSAHQQCRSLQPALQLISTITRVQVLQTGDKVSYNYTFTAPEPMCIGILPLGYHEGVPRDLSGGGMVMVAGRPQPIVGRVCMNHTMVDLRHTAAKAGDEVIVFSNNPTDANSIEGVAARHQLFSYALLTGLSPDIRRYLVA